MKLTDIQGAAKILKCSVQQVYLLEKRDHNPLPVHYPTMRSFVKVYNGKNTFELMEIPDKLRGKNRPKKVYFESELREWLNSQ